MLIRIGMETQEVLDDGQYYVVFYDWINRPQKYLVLPQSPVDRPHEPVFAARLMRTKPLPDRALLIANLCAVDIQEVLDHPKDFRAPLRCIVWSAKRNGDELQLSLLTTEQTET